MGSLFVFDSDSDSERLSCQAGGQQCIEWLGNKRRPLALALQLKPGAMALAKARDSKVITEPTEVKLGPPADGTQSSEARPRVGRHCHRPLARAGRLSRS
eukprot:8905148-Pyramimonas_sp.AAC.1